MDKFIIDKEKAAQRLKEFGLSKYGSIKEFAENLEMRPSVLQTGYLSGRSLPGAAMIGKLILLGCDVKWLLYGLNSKIDDTNSELIELRSENKKLRMIIKNINKLTLDAE